MKIHGLQKLTLLDYPGHVACTVFLGGCNYRCPYCHNSGILTADAQAAMEEDELLRFLDRRKGILDGVCITGGEPTLRPDLQDLMQKIRALGFRIKLDTNGSRPEILEELLAKDLVDSVAMDIKNAPDRYAKTCGVAAVDIGAIRKSARLLMESAPDYEFRTTVVDGYHDADAMRAIAEWLSGAKQYFLQPFADRDSVLVKGLSTPATADLMRYRDILAEKIASVQIRGIDLDGHTDS